VAVAAQRARTFAAARIPEADHPVIPTVKSHVGTILGKLGVESRTQAALQALQAHIVSASELQASPGVTPFGGVAQVDERLPTRTQNGRCLHVINAAS
jgi:hypothetical protein